jgi:hypothetical protein
MDKLRNWFKGIIEKLLSWRKDSPSEEDVPVRTPAELQGFGREA